MSDWPPVDARVRAALWRGKRHLARGEHFAALSAFSEASRLAAGGERETARGLFHLAVAGYKRGRGDERGALRQLEHARRRLAGAPASLHGVDVAGLAATLSD